MINSFNQLIENVFFFNIKCKNMYKFKIHEQDLQVLLSNFKNILGRNRRFLIYLDPELFKRIVRYRRGMATHLFFN